jgi:uncharacterized membrane protein
MTTTATRHPVLARDVARSYISVGVGMAVVTAILYGLVFLAPSVLIPLGRDQIVRVFCYSGWALFCLTYIALSLIAFSRLSAEELRSATAATEPDSSGMRRFWWALNGGGAIWWALTGAAVTLVTLIELIASGQELTPLLIGSCVTVVVVTAALIVVAFAVNYAREDAVRGGLRFPGEDEPRFGDYLYFSIQVTTTFGGSDVEVLHRGMRRIVSMHSVIAFTFNTVIIALLVSVLVGRLA